MIDFRNFLIVLETQDYNQKLAKTLVQGSADTKVTAKLLQDGREVKPAQGLQQRSKQTEQSQSL